MPYTLNNPNEKENRPADHPVDPERRPVDPPGPPPERPPRRYRDDRPPQPDRRHG